MPLHVANILVRVCARHSALPAAPSGGACTLSGFSYPFEVFNSSPAAVMHCAHVISPKCLRASSHLLTG